MALEVFCHSQTHTRKGFIIKVKKILECICVNCGKLKADIVSLRLPFSSARFAPPPPQFSGGSLFGEPQTRSTFVPRKSRAFSHPRERGPGARFRSLDRRVYGPLHIQRSGAGWTRGSAVKRGAEREVRKKGFSGCCSRQLAARNGQTALSVKQIEGRVPGRALVSENPPVLLLCPCVVDSVILIAHADVFISHICSYCEP